jgi:dihydrofolate reductase
MGQSLELTGAIARRRPALTRRARRQLNPADRRTSLLDYSSFRQGRLFLMTKRRNVIVHIATSADGYIAGPDGDLEWLTSRPAPEGFYGLNAFMRSIDTKLLGRKTYEASLRLGAKFDATSRTIVFSRQAPPADAPPGVEFVSGAIGPFVGRLRGQPGKDVWLMGGGDLIASFLDEHAIDEFVISVAPVFIGDGIPLIARRHRHVPLELRSLERFEDGLVQLRYRVADHS